MAVIAQEISELLWNSFQEEIPGRVMDIQGIAVIFILIQ
jgi:hypothetical protein